MLEQEMHQLMCVTSTNKQSFSTGSNPHVQPLNPNRAMCQSSSFWSCSWLLADWSCAIPNGGQHC